MSIPGKVLIALLSSLVVAAVAALLEPSCSFVGLLLPTALASIASVVLSHRALPVPEAIATETASSPAQAARPEKRGSRGEGRRDGTGDGGRQQRGGRARDRTRADKRNGRGEERRAAKREPAENRRDEQRGSSAGAGSATAASTPRGEPEEGTVKWFNVTKGYGFIIRASGEEIFVHHRSVLGEGRGRLEDGARVRFRVAQTDKGPQAEEVEPL